MNCNTNNAFERITNNKPQVGKDIINNAFGLIEKVMSITGMTTISSSASTSGNVGDFIWDNSYLYLKTNIGWGRIPMNYNFNPSFSSLKITFTDISNSPVLPAGDLVGWNAFFDTAVNADAPFNSIEVGGNTVFLYGPSNLIISADTFNSNPNIISIADDPFVTEIKDAAFNVCQYLESISFPILEKVGSYSFWSCNTLRSVSLPLATNIGTYSFSNCYALTSATFDNLTVIANNAFDSCTSLVDISFPKVTAIGNNSFLSCTKLKGASFPLATSIGANAFTGNLGLAEVSFPRAITIGDGAFFGCSILANITLTAATSIGTNTFRGCNLLQYAVLPCVETIGNSSFNECYGLTKAIFSAATTIENGAFAYCTSVEEIYHWVTEQVETSMSRETGREQVY